MYIVAHTLIEARPLLFDNGDFIQNSVFFNISENKLLLMAEDSSLLLFYAIWILFHLNVFYFTKRKGIGKQAVGLCGFLSRYNTQNIN